MAYKNPEDQKAAARRWYMKNREDQIRKAKDVVKARRKYLFSLIGRYKRRRGCDACGYNKIPQALEFHHTASEDKFRTVATMLTQVYRLRTIKDEISKCSLLCSNCHREAHYLGT